MLFLCVPFTDSVVNVLFLSSIWINIHASLYVSFIGDSFYMSDTKQNKCIIIIFILLVYFIIILGGTSRLILHVYENITSNFILSSLIFHDTVQIKHFQHDLL